MEKKIIIQSESSDRSTDDVISWLYYYTKNVDKIYTLLNTTKIQNLSIKLSNDKNVNLKINNIDFSCNYWYRRGQFSFNHYLNSIYTNMNKELYANNIYSIEHFLNNIAINRLNRYNDNYVEKLDVFKKCIDLKIKIPEILITDNLFELKKFILKHDKIITKRLRNPFDNIQIDRESILLPNSYEVIGIKDIDKIAAQFMPSCFQEYVEKKYEIRSFFICGEFYSVAIFSQSNSKTKVDFRNYDYECPNRIVPYKLTKKLENKISKLMKELELNSGSIDILINLKDEYVFLEVNPIGQFQWISRNCNLLIEKEIAKLLLSDKIKN